MPDFTAGISDQKLPSASWKAVVTCKLRAAESKSQVSLSASKTRETGRLSPRTMCNDVVHRRPGLRARKSGSGLRLNGRQRGGQPSRGRYAHPCNRRCLTAPSRTRPSACGAEHRHVRIDSLEGDRIMELNDSNMQSKCGLLSEQVAVKETRVRKGAVHNDSGMHESRVARATLGNADRTPR